MAKTRKEFLGQLRLALAWRLPPGEVQEIMADYGGFFADGASEGKTEEELCAQFGAPKDVAGEILKEEGRSAGRLGLLALVWTALAALLNWWWTWWQFGLYDVYPVLYVIQLALIPLLWLFWRGVLDAPAFPASRGWQAILWGGSTAAWAAVYGYVMWGMFVLIPRWQTLPPEVQAAGSNMGPTAGVLYEIAAAVLLALILVSLLRTWWEGTHWYLPGTAWCVGLHCSLARLMQTLRCVDPGSSLETAMTEVWLKPLIALGVAAAGGAALTAFLVWRGGRHGRPT